MKKLLSAILILFLSASVVFASNFKWRSTFAELDAIEGLADGDKGVVATTDSVQFYVREGGVWVSAYLVTRSATTRGEWRGYELTGNGDNYIAVRFPESLASNITLDWDGSDAGFGSLNLVTAGYVTGGTRPVVISSPSGTHDGTSGASALSDSGESFTTNAYVGTTLYNITDGSSGTVTANTATTITATLTGGTDNDWDTGDVWQVGPGPKQGGSWIYVTNAGTIRHPAAVGYAACYESDAAAILKVDMASDSMIFQGVLDTAVVALDAGDSIVSSGSTTGDFMCIHNKSATEAQGKGKRGTWVDGGAS